MSLEASPIIIERTCPAPPDVVWAALTDPDQMSAWFFEPIRVFEPTLGSETRFAVHVDAQTYEHVWRVTEARPGESLAYSWQYEGIEGDSTVRWEVTSTGELGTTIRLTHTGHGTFPRDNPVFSRAAGVSGWSYFLDRLAAHVAG